MDHLLRTGYPAPVLRDGGAKVGRDDKTSLPSLPVEEIGTMVPVKDAGAGLETLLVVSSLLGSPGLRLGRVLHLGLDAVAGYACAEAGAVFLLDRARRELVARAVSGGYAPTLKGKVFASTIGIPGWVVEHGQDVSLADAPSDPRFDPALDLETGFVTASVLCVPLRGPEGALGALFLAKHRGSEPFAPQDRSVVRAVAHQLAVVVHERTLADRVASMEARLRDMEQARAAYITTASHELQTPLTLLKAHLELARMAVEERDEATCTDLDEALDGLAVGLSRLEGVVSSLVTTSVISTGHLPIEPTDGDLVLLLWEVVTGMEHLALKRRIILTVQHEVEELTLRFDHARLKNALDQLVLNALRFTQDGGRVTLGCRPIDAGALVWVSDTGIGISDEDQARIFEPLVELGDVLHHHSGTEAFLSRGLGLGLTVVKGVVEAHHGRVWVQSRVGEGSTFFLELPSVA